MAIVDRVKAICLKPKDEWQVIAGETTPPADLLKKYAMPLAAIGAVAGFIRMSVVESGSSRVLFTTGLIAAVVGLGLMLALVYVFGLTIDALAPQFGAEKNPSRALRVAVYSFTPGWVAAALQIIPALEIFGLVAIGYSVYVMHLGLVQLMKPAKDKAAPYTALATVCGVLLCVVWRIIVRAVIAPSS
jgi:hypothetical protein